ncbi:unnamed protein product, partial [Owenia fusiformis]
YIAACNSTIQRRFIFIVMFVCLTGLLLCSFVLDFKDLKYISVKHLDYTVFNWTFTYRDKQAPFEIELPDFINITKKGKNIINCTEWRPDEASHDEIKAINNLADNYAEFLKRFRTQQENNTEINGEPTPAELNIKNVLTKSSIIQSEAVRDVCERKMQYICKPIIENLESNPRDKIIIPFENFFKPFSELKHTRFFSELRNKLELFPTKMIYSIGITYNYIPSLINWILIARQLCVPPIGEILVYSRDIEVCEFLNVKNINVICLHYDVDELRSYDDVTMKFNNDKISRQMMWITRVLLWRLVNYFGYDIVTFDTDALPLQNPSVVFDRFPNADLIGSQSARVPGYLYAFWQLNPINMGMVLMRSSLNNTIFWNVVGKISEKLPNKADDQVIINLALLCLNTRWQHPPLRFIYRYPDDKTQMLRYNEEINTGTVPIVGKTDYHVKIIGIQGHQICRYSCLLKRLYDVIVWHKCTKQSQGALWLLSTNWSIHDVLSWQQNQNGDKWIDIITNFTSLENIQTKYLLR